MLMPISGSRTALSACRSASSVGKPRSSVGTSAKGVAPALTASAVSSAGQPPRAEVVEVSVIGDAVFRFPLVVGGDGVLEGHPAQQRALDADGELGHALERD